MPRGTSATVAQRRATLCASGLPLGAVTFEAVRAFPDRGYRRRDDPALFVRLVCDTLGELLDYLGQCAGREVPRAAVLVVRGERLQGWRFTGFGGATPAATTFLAI